MKCYQDARRADARLKKQALEENKALAKMNIPMVDEGKYREKIEETFGPTVIQTVGGRDRISG